MRWVFWSASALIAYTYAGYPAWLWLRSRVHQERVQTAPYYPFISIVMVARNEEQYLEAKLLNLLGLDYPNEKREIVVISDSSTDGTDTILARYSDFLVTSRMPEAEGKAAGLNRAFTLCKGEIVVFTDVRQTIEAQAIVKLLENFADPKVGCVSGELMLGDPARGEVSQGMGLYWRIEKRIREMESSTGSVVGATGALYAVRRDLLETLPADLILDDVLIPMQVARKGLRVLFEPRTRAWDSPNLGGEREFKRKVRTLTGNYQLLQIAPWLLTKTNPIRFEFISHKLLRLAVPLALVALLISSALLRGPVYRLGLGLQLCVYALSCLAIARLNVGPLSRFADAALTFVVLNLAAAVAFLNFVRGRRMVWVR